MGHTAVFRKLAFSKPAFLGTEFNEFLFAPIGADASGTYLTVVSAFARLDLDPWAEAASLASLPGSIATQKLAELVSRFPEIPPVRVDAAQIAARLTALLPGKILSKIPAPKLSIGTSHPATQALMAPRFLLFLMFLTLGVMLATQVVVAQLHPPAHINSAVQTVTPKGSQIKLRPAMISMSKPLN